MGLVSLIFTFAMSVAGAEDERMNLIAIVTDDQSLWSVGCYGNDEVETPTMDRIAAEGAKFTNAFVATPVCSPSRASYMTGRWGTELGITDFISRVEFERGVGLPNGAVLWPRVLKEHGYQTAMIGKWHLGGQQHQLPRQHGFDYFFGKPRGSFKPVNPELERHLGQRTKMVETKGYSSEVITDDALNWVREMREEPFLLCLHFREPHTPYAPVPPVDRKVYEGMTPTTPKRKGLVQKQVEDWTRDYYAAIHAVDRNVGRLLDLLDELELTERTIVLFTSDHGYNIGHHGVHTKGNSRWVAGGVGGPKRPNMWDTSLRVPLMIRWPGVVKPGTIIDETVSHLDMYRTVIGMLGVEHPEYDGPLPHGTDFSPLLRGEVSSLGRDTLFGQYDLHNNGLAYMRMIRTDDWKLVRHYRCEGLDEMYDLKNDPGETRNLYTSRRHTGVREELQNRLDLWMESIDDPLLADRKKPD